MVIRYRTFKRLVQYPLSSMIGFVIGRIVTVQLQQVDFIPQLLTGNKFTLSWMVFNLIGYYAYLFGIYLKFKFDNDPN